MSEKSGNPWLVRVGFVTLVCCATDKLLNSTNLRALWFQDLPCGWVRAWKSARFTHLSKIGRFLVH